MKLICEASEDVKYVISEDTGGNTKKNFYITGVFAEAETLNRNKRVYPKGVMVEAIQDYITNKVDRHTSYGELDHPQGPKINPDRISHLIESLTWNGNQVIGKAKILDTPMGNIARGIMEGGGTLGVSTRGLGALKQNSKGLMEVQSGLKFSTVADIVTDPSAHNAWVESIVENTDFYYDNMTGEWRQSVVEDTVKNLKKYTTKELQEKSYELYKKFIRDLYHS